MTLLRRLGAALAVLLLVVACAPALASAPPSSLRFMTLGDSETIGYGSQHDGYRAELGRLLAAGGVQPMWTNTASAHTGWTVQDLRAGIDGWMATDVPDVVLLNIGTNNAAGVTPGMSGFESAYLDLVSRILALRASTQVYVAMVPYSVASWAPNEVTVNVAVIHASWNASGRVHLVDLSVLPPCLLWDGVHPADEGYDAMGRQWYRALADVYDLPEIPPDPFRAGARRPGYERAATDGSC